MVEVGSGFGKDNFIKGILLVTSIAAVGFSRGRADIFQPGMPIPGMSVRTRESRGATTSPS